MASTPEPPDPKETAAAQGAMNRETAITQQQLNMVNQVNPWGNVNYTQTGETGYFDQDGKYIKTPQYTQTTNLSPQQQAIFDQTQKAQGNLATIANNQSSFLKDYLSKGVDVSGAPALATPNGMKTSIGGNFATGVNQNKNIEGIQTSYAGADDFSADRQRVEDALMARQQPAMQEQEDRIRSQLVASGLRPGTQAYNSEMERLSRQQTDTRNSVIGAAGEEQARLVGMAQNAAAFNNASVLSREGFNNNAALQQFQAQNAASLTGAQFQNAAQMDQMNAQNAARQQYISELYAQRNQPLNEIAALMNGSQIANPAQQSGPTPTTSVAGVDYTGLVNQKYQAELAQSQSMMGGIFGLGGALGGALIMSDRRAKWGIRRIMKLASGLPYYAFRYKGDNTVHYGYMADEVAELFPWAVSRLADGFMRVDYGAIARAS